MGGWVPQQTFSYFSGYVQLDRIYYLQNRQRYWIFEVGLASTGMEIFSHGLHAIEHFFSAVPGRRFAHDGRGCMFRQGLGRHGDTYCGRHRGGGDCTPGRVERGNTRQ